MRANSLWLLVTSFVLPLAVLRCDCGEVLGSVPTPEIEVLDDTGQSHKTAEPWLTVDFGDADRGQAKTRPLTVKNIGRAALDIVKVCVVNAIDAQSALTAPCIVGQATSFSFLSLVGSEIKAGDSADMVVTFAPAAGGPAQLFLQIGSSAEEEPVVAVELIGRGTDGRLCAEPSAAYDFGQVDVGVTAPGTLTVRNCGVKPVTIDTFAFTQNPDSAFSFSVQGGTAVGRTLLEGEAIILDLSFTPQQAGPYRDTRAGDITIVTAAPFVAQYDLILLGDGRVPPSCKVNVVPDVLNFNAVASGTSSTRQIIIQSVGQCGCTVESITGPVPADAGFALGALPALPLVLKGTVGCDGDPVGVDVAATNVSIEVTYTSPVRDVPAADHATVTVATSDLLEPSQIIELEANGGGAPFCQFDVTPREGDGGLFDPPTQGRYGTVEFGRTSVFVGKSLPIVFTNIGNTPCHISGVVYDKAENTLAHEFSLQNATGGTGVGTTATVQPGDTTTFFAVFSPTHTIEGNGFFPVGEYSGENSLCGSAFFGISSRCNGVTFTTDDTVTLDAGGLAIDGIFSIGFKGTPVEPDVDVIPGQLDFGLVTLDCGSPEQRVTLYNNGGADLIVGQPVIDPAASPVLFEVTGTNPPVPAAGLAVPPGGSMAINVRYYARALGLQTANLAIPTREGTQAGPPVLVPLRGEGTLDISQVDIFDQLTDPQVDLLWVVDDSGSMATFQAELAANFGEFFVDSNIDESDFHIAVTTTLWADESCLTPPPTCSVDADCGPGGDCLFGLCTAGTAANTCEDDEMAGYYTVCNENLGHFITPASANPESEFGCNVRVADHGNVNPDRPASDNAEGGLRAAMKFLSPPLIDDPNINGGFLREQAKLHIIFVEDEPEQSKGSIQQYIDFFKNVKGFRNDGLVAVSAIAAPPEGCAYTDSSGQAVQLQDDRYLPVVEEMNGRFQSICNTDWSGMMSQLGLDSLGLRVEFFLTRAATVESIDVCVRQTTTAACVNVAETSDSAANGYFYDSVTNSVVFNGTSVPPRGSRVEIAYNAFCFLAP